MDILYFSAGWPVDDFPNGIITSTANIVDAMRAQGHNARVLSATGHDNGDEYVTIVPKPNRKSFVQKLTRAAATVVDRYGSHFVDMPIRIAAAINANQELRSADVLEVEESFGWSYEIGRRLSVPVVMRLHGPYFLNEGMTDGPEFDAFERERVRRERRSYEHAVLVSAPSRYVLEKVRQKYNLPLSYAMVIPNTFASGSIPRQWSQSRADWDEILFVGRFDRIKGADLALKAFASLAAVYPRLRLTFVGSSDQIMTTDGQTGNCNATVSHLMPPDAASRVNFVGVVPNSRLDEMRSRAGITLVASRTETFSFAVMEALRCGSPVVATRVGGIPEVVRDGQDAMLAEPHPEDIARAIMALLKNRELAAELGSTGAEHITSNFAPAKVAELTSIRYAEALDRLRSGRNK